MNKPSGDTYKVVVLKNYDPETNPNEVVFEETNCNLLLINVGRKDSDGIVRTRPCINGDYLDLTRGYLAIGAHLSHLFNSSRPKKEDEE